MSTRDPFDQRIAELSGGAASDPFEERIAELSGVRSGPIDEESRGAWNRFLETVENYARTIEAFTPTGMLQQGALPRQASAIAGGIGGSLIEPAKALVEIPMVAAAELEDRLGVKGVFVPARNFSRKAENFLERARVGIYSVAEQQAMASGVSESQLADAYAVGNFVGFMAPVAASVKAASLILRSPTALMMHPFSGTILVDATAGAIYGSTFKQGDTLEERGKNLLNESALFGISRLVLNGLPVSFQAYRMKRVRELAAAAEVEANIAQGMNSIAPPVGSSEGAISLARLLSEENYIASSASAQDILARSADESALIQAIFDLNRAKATGGRVRNFTRTPEEMQQTLDRFREQFPGLRFEVVSRNVGSRKVEILPHPAAPKALPGEPFMEGVPKSAIDPQLAPAIVRRAEAKLSDIRRTTSETLGERFGGSWEKYQRAVTAAREEVKAAWRKADPVRAEWIYGEQMFDITNAAEVDHIADIVQQAILRKDHTAALALLDRGFDPKVTGSWRNLENLKLPPKLDKLRKIAQKLRDNDKEFQAERAASERFIEQLRARYTETGRIAESPQPRLEPPSTQTLPSAGAPSEFSVTKPEIPLPSTREPIKSYDIIFGTKGLSNKQRSQLAAETRAGYANPRFEGMRVFRGTDEFIYVGRASRPDYIKLKRSDDTIVEVLERNVTDLPAFQEEIVPTPELDALYQDFAAFFREGEAALASTGGALPESSLVRLAREGKLKITDEGRRAFDVGGAIVYPEELGLRTGPESISKITLARMQPQPAGGPSQAVISRNTSSGQWRIAYYSDDMVPVGLAEFSSIDDAMRAAQGEGWIPAEVVRSFPTIGDVTSAITRNGIEFANVLDTPGVVTFEQAFDNWVAARKIPLDAGDIGAARAAFASRLRKEMWDLVPAEDRKIFESVRAELDALVDSGALPFEALAHQKGFHVQRAGEVVELREINTGARFAFGSERFAADFLREVVRDERGLVNLLDMGANGMASFSGGFGNPAAEWKITAESILKQTAEQIPQSSFRNVRDWFISLENTLGIPLFSRGFSEVDTGYSRFRVRYEPFAKLIQDAWSGLGSRAKEDVVKFWQSVEGKGLDIAATRDAAKLAGLSKHQIRAFEKARAIWDEGFKMAGLPPSRYINNYYGRVKPWLEKNNGPLDLDEIFGPEGVPAEFEFFAEMSRTGELAMVELDPEIVMHKWFRSLFFKQEVKPSWDRLAQLVDRGHGKYKKPALTIRELPQETIDAIVKANPRVNINDPVLAPPIRDVVSEYLTIIRGNPGEGLEKLRWFSRKLFSSLGVNADERVLEEYFNTYMSGMYGAAMAARPSLVARNATQTIWNLYPRLGSRYAGESLARAMTQEGFNEALDAGAIRLAEAGIPYGDAIFEHMFQNMRLEGSGPLSNAVAAAVRKGLRMGWVTRKTAEKLLIPYSSGDQAGRAWAYWWHKLHTERVLNQFETRRIGWEKFEEDGLPFFSRVVKDEFANIYRAQGKEAALKFIGKQGSDETHFIYGVGAQPAWMQRPLGRLFGMFGTWPLWAHELYFRRMAQGTFGQKAAFWARNAALMGIYGNMSAQAGIDLFNWISPLGIFGWSGGPIVDHAINAKRVIDAPMDQKAAALKRMVADVGRLALPGQMFVQYDVPEAAAMDNPRDAFLRIMVGKPVDSEHFSMSYLFSGDDVPNYSDLLPETREAIEPVAPRPLDLPSVEEMMEMMSGASGPTSIESFNSGSSGFDLSGLEGNM